jgi:hypothetical protein
MPVYPTLRLRIEYPTAPKPMRNIAQVGGSGTGATLDKLYVIRPVKPAFRNSGGAPTIPELPTEANPKPRKLTKSLPENVADPKTSMFVSGKQVQRMVGRPSSDVPVTVTELRSCAVSQAFRS